MGLEQRDRLYSENITKKDLPCWYELSWQKESPALILRIHKDFIQNLELPPDVPILKSFMEEFNLASSSLNFQQDVGFENSFKRQGEKDNFVIFRAEIPEIATLGKEKCPGCKGSKKRDFDRECLECSGTGKQINIDWHRAYAVSASLSLLTKVLSHREKVLSTLPQLLTLKTAITADMNRAPVWGEIGLTLRNWLITQDTQPISQEIVQAMQSAYQKMWAINKLSRCELAYFRSQIDEKGLFYIECPGTNSCSIFHDQAWDIGEGKGYNFTNHNIDTPLQQLTLVAGLAVLHDYARREIK